MLNLRNVPELTVMRFCAPLFVFHRDLENVSEHLNDGRGVFSGTWMLDMSDRAWLARKTKTQKSESTVDANAVEPSQKDVNNLSVTVSFSLDEETMNTSNTQQSRSSETALQRDG